jgi:cell division protein FtsA
MQAATGSPLDPEEPEEPLAPLDPELPLDPEEPLLPEEPEAPLLLPEEPLLPPPELEEVEPSPPELLEQAANRPPATQARKSEAKRFDPMFRALSSAFYPSAGCLGRRWRRLRGPPNGEGTGASFVTYLAVRIRLCEPWAEMSTMASQGEIVVGLDIGTTKVCAVVGEIAEDGITILGVGSVPCRGLRKGIVSNIDWTVRSIKDAIEAAQTMAGVEIRTVYAGVAGSHIRSQSSDGVAAIAGGEVTRADVERVLEGARAIPVDADRQILHVLPREYVVDIQDGIRDPIGMSGVRLGAKVNLVTAATSCVQNVIRCAERCGLVVADVVLEPLASSEAVLSDDEREIGVAVVDIGGGTTDLLIYVDGGIAHASVIPVGGNNITNDIAAGLRTPMAEADRLKRLCGCALARMVGEDEDIEVPGVGGQKPRRTPRRVLSDIIEPRVEEIFAVVRKRIEDTGLLEQISAGVVLTGGAVLLEGTQEIAEEILGMPVRIGFPTGVRGITQLVHGPQYATGVGLVKYGAQAIADAHARAATPAHSMMRMTAAAVKKAEDERPEELPKSQSKLWEWLKAAF